MTHMRKNSSLPAKFLHELATVFLFYQDRNNDPKDILLKVILLHITIKLDNPKLKYLQALLQVSPRFQGLLFPTGKIN